MATIVKTPAGTWKAVIRKTGWPTNAKTFRTKRDAEDWSRRTEDEMVRGVYIQRSGSERLTLENALQRYLREVSPTKSPPRKRPRRLRLSSCSSTWEKYSLVASRYVARAPIYRYPYPRGGLCTNRQNGQVHPPRSP